MSDEKDIVEFSSGTSKPGAQVSEGTTQTFIKGLALGGHGALPAAIDVKNGRIVRIRPLHLDWKYSSKQLNPWTINVRGKTFEAPLTIMQPPFNLAYKKRIYSPNRILYPLVRVDWNPNGDRNPQNRGKSKFRKISYKFH